MNSRRAWFGLITFCVTPAVVFAFSAAVLFMGAAAAFAGPEAAIPIAVTRQADNRSARVFAGLLTDDHCGARHNMDSDMNPAECTKMCVRNGSRYVLVEGNRRYDVTGNENQLAALAGQRVNIAGVLHGNTIQVNSTTSAQ